MSFFGGGGIPYNALRNLQQALCQPSAGVPLARSRLTFTDPNWPLDCSGASSVFVSGMLTLASHNFELDNLAAGTVVELVLYNTYSAPCVVSVTGGSAINNLDGLETGISIVPAGEYLVLIGIAGNSNIAPTISFASMVSGIRPDAGVAPAGYARYTASRTLNASNVGGVVYVDTTNAVTLTVPDAATICNYSGNQIGAKIDVYAMNTGVVTFAAGVGATILSRSTSKQISGQGGHAELRATATPYPAHNWLLSGDLAA